MQFEKSGEFIECFWIDPALDVLASPFHLDQSRPVKFLDVMRDRRGYDIQFFAQFSDTFPWIFFIGYTSSTWFTALNQA